MRLTSLVVSALARLMAGDAAACPSCETALQARAALWQRGDFWSQLLIVTSPLLLMGVLALALYAHDARSAEP